MKDLLNSNYFSGQGEIFLAKRDSTGTPGALFMIGNAPKFEVKPTVERRKHKESRSGNRLYDKVQTVTKGGQLTITIEDIRKDNLALVLMGKKVALGSGSYSGSTYDTFPSGLIVGSIVQLAKPSASSIVVKDSAGTPATLVAGTDYEVLDAGHGLIRILNLGSYVQPFRAQYSYAATDVVTAMEANDDDEYALYFAGVNTEGTPTDQRIGFRIYRIVFDPAQLIALINDEQGSFDIQGEILKDLTKAADANFGGFARWDYIDANS
ncbi:MAG TPA: hypothetical protein VGV59_10000 [Pyrinomonadaceae bacterium]|nr:hypothetical protein [Pyrinomonadaceae bacterium]